MAKFDLKITAHKLRRMGMSIGDIATELGVAKSTASVWCRDLPLTTAQREKIKENAYRKGHRGRIVGAQRNHQAKLERISRAEERARKMLRTIKNRDRFMIGVGLYWGEGVKAERSTTAFVNADPQSVVFMKRWFTDFFDITEDRFNPYIFISQQHSGRELEVRTFWSKQLALPLSQCKKVVYLQDRPKKVYENHKMYYGTLALRIRKSSELKYTILGLLKCL